MEPLPPVAEAVAPEDKVAGLAALLRECDLARHLEAATAWCERECVEGGWLSLVMSSGWRCCVTFVPEVAPQEKQSDEPPRRIARRLPLAFPRRHAEALAEPLWLSRETLR